MFLYAKRTLEQIEENITKWYPLITNFLPTDISAILAESANHPSAITNLSNLSLSNGSGITNIIDTRSTSKSSKSSIKNSALRDISDIKSEAEKAQEFYEQQRSLLDSKKKNARKMEDEYQLQQQLLLQQQKEQEKPKVDFEIDEKTGKTTKNKKARKKQREAVLKEMEIQKERDLEEIEKRKAAMIAQRKRELMQQKREMVDNEVLRRSIAAHNERIWIFLRIFFWKLLVFNLQDLIFYVCFYILHTMSS